VASQYVADRRRERSYLRSERALRPLLGYLRALGIVPAAEAAVPEAAGEVLLARFAAYLASERGLAPATVSSYLFQVRPFVAAHADAGRWSSLAAGQVARFVARSAAGLRPRSAQVRASALRALLGFMWQEGLVVCELAGAVGSFAAPAGAGPPRGLSPGQAGRLLAAVRAGGPAGVRDEPMVALMLRLALRAGEVAALLLEDIDWRSGVVSVRGKGGRLDQVPLPADVGQPLARYLRHGRPAGTVHRQVFLALDAPHGPLTASAVVSVAGRALADAGITGPGAAHRFRHTAACGVLAAGGGLAEAGQLLRHASLQATAVYAKADIAALRSTARPWPGAAR
jgi:integrase/recombinase XerD